MNAIFFIDLVPEVSWAIALNRNLFSILSIRNNEVDFEAAASYLVLNLISRVPRDSQLSHRILPQSKNQRGSDC